MTQRMQRHKVFGSDNKDLEDHIRALRRYARALIGDTADADDLVQETLRRALTYIGRGREIRDVRAYLLTMLHNARVDLFKQQKRAGQSLPLEDGPQLAEMPRQNDNVAMKRVAEAIACLPEEQREVLLLVGLEGMGYRETAEIIGSPIGTVMSRLSRARLALKNALEWEGTIEVEAMVVCGRPGRTIAEANHVNGYTSRAA